MNAPAGIDAAGESFGQRHHVGHDAVAIAGEAIPATAQAGLHLVGDKERPASIARLANGAQISGRRDVNAPFPLHRLDEKRRGVVQGFVEYVTATVGNAERVREQRAEGPLKGFAAADRERAQRLSVIGVERADDLRASGRGARELHRALDRLGSAVAPKRDLEIAGSQLGEAARGAPQHHVEHRLARERHQLELRAHRGEHARMAVPQRKDAVAAGKIEIGLPALIPDRRALRAHLDGRSGDLHHARQRRIHEPLVVLVRLRCEFLRRGGAVEVVARFDHAATSAADSRRAIVASIVSIASAALSIRIMRSRSAAAPGMPLR